MQELFVLFRSFFVIGLFTFGGGYAMLPMLQKEVVEKRHWASEEELVDYFAIGQCTPGIIAVNTATFIGYKKKGIPGGIMATLGVICPSLIIITVIAALFTNYKDVAWIAHAFAGIRCAVTVLIGASVCKIAKSSLIDLPTIMIAVVVLLLNLTTQISPVVVVLLAAIAGLAISYGKGRASS